MSKTTTVKEEILHLLQDQKPHFVADIKSTIREKHPNEEITEGIFSNALRTMTIAGKCQNPERGVYKIGVPEKNKLTKQTNGQQKLPYQELRKEVLRMAREMRSDFNNRVKDVDVSVDDVDLLQYILRVRAAFDKFENEIGN